jgi:hypothetical protein
MKVNEEENESGKMPAKKETLGMMSLMRLSANPVHFAS